MSKHAVKNKFRLLNKFGHQALTHRVYLKDRKLQYRWGNEAFLQDAGLISVSDLEGKKEGEMPWPTLASNIEETDRNVISGKADFLNKIEERTSRKDKKIEVTVLRRPIFSTDGEVIGLMGFYPGNPEREEETHPFFLETLPLPAVLYDLREDCAYTNKKFAEKLLPLPKEERNRILSFLKSHDDVATTDFLSSTIHFEGREYACFSSHHTDYKVAILVDITEHTRTHDELLKANEWLKAWIWELEYHNRKLEIIHQMGCALQLCRSISDAGSVIKKYLPRLVETAGGTMYLPDETRRRLQVLASYGDHGNLNKNMVAEECIAFRYGRIVPPQENSCLHCLSLPGKNDFSLFCLPMMISGRPEGVLSLRIENGETGEGMEKELLIIATEYISLAFGNLQLQDQLMHQATRDALTNLFNRRYMEESLNREFFRCQRKGLPLSLILIDIDFFKSINDRYGHDAGDFVLKKFAGYLLQSIRKEDIACRYGGEEFVVILPETPLEAAVIRAEQLRKKIMISSLEYRGEIITDISVSMGVATWPHHGEDPMACLKAADLALYRAKEEGRNRVVVATGEHANNNGKSYLDLQDNPSLLNRH